MAEKDSASDNRKKGESIEAKWPPLPLNSIKLCYKDRSQDSGSRRKHERNGGDERNDFPLRDLSWHLPAQWPTLRDAPNILIALKIIYFNCIVAALS